MFHRYLISSLLFILISASISKGQIPSFPRTNRQDIRLDATIQNRMSNEEFMLRIAQIRDSRAADERESARMCAAQTLSLYNSISNRPFSITNGWYNVAFSDESPSCGTRKVYVENNRVRKWLTSSGINERPVVFSSPIEKGKSLVRLGLTDGTESGMVAVYFLENLMDLGATASAPQSGKVSFWTNYKRLRGIVEIYIDDQLIGSLNSYFETQPNCGQEGVVTFTYKPGSYNYTAKSANLTWQGTIEIVNGGCGLHCLVKK